MKRCIIITVLLLVVKSNSVDAQTVPDSIYYKRLYYTAKVWGFLKYFHSEVAKGSQDWDAELLQTLENVKNDVSNQDFNNTMGNLINSAGDMAVSTTQPPDIPESLKYNLDFTWLSDTVFSYEVKAGLDTVRNRFRPQNNYYVGRTTGASNPTFKTDNQFYQWGVNQYPEKEYRLLALFRYWNIINYFYPYKYILDQNWDSTLVEFIPKMVSADSDMTYHLTFLELATRINDSHAFTYSQLINETIFGYYFLPLTLKYVENQTVITGIYTNNDNIEVGDIIKSINGIDIDTLRNNLRKYTHGSNKPSIERNINTRLLRGQHLAVQMILENENGEKEVTVSRNVHINDYSDLIANSGDIWKILNVDSKKYGYVDMSRLEVIQINLMLNKLWDTDGIIFDIRNYPRGTLWSLVRFFFDAPIHIANFTVPNIEYPGTLNWHYETIGTGVFSSTYRKKIFILFDESTQSQAEYTVMGLEQHPKAVKIGSQTSGADGNISSIYLPGGILTVFTGLGVFYPDYTETQRVGIIPDVEVHPTIEGIRAGRDEVLEAALYYIPSNIAEQNASKLPEDIYLYQNYPNPFNSSTQISYSLPSSGHVRLILYDIRGRKVKTLVDEFQSADRYSVTVNLNEFPSGIYLYKLNVSEKYSEIKKMLLVR